MNWIANYLRDSSVKDLNVDGGDRLLIHGKILARKPMLQDVFNSFHHAFDRLDRRFLSAAGLRVELGAGVAPIRDSYPDVLATDLVAGPHLDRVINAEQMDFPDQSVRVIFGQNCFHHFPHPDRFFNELNRVLPDGGGCILLEPYYGPAAAFTFKRLFSTEGYDKQYSAWDTPSTGPMNGANQALSYIVFKRDRAEFQQKYPKLKIVHHEVCNNYLPYLFSGGLNFRQLWPDKALPVLSAFQFALKPFSRLLGLHHIIVLRKEA